MKKSIFQRGIAGLLALVMCLTSLFTVGVTTVFAVGEQGEVYMVAYPRSSDPNYSANWGHGDIAYMNGWNTSSSDHITIRAIDSYEGQVCYCIEPGVSLNVGDRLTEWDENFWDNYPSAYNKTIEPDIIKLLIGRIMTYGYQGNISTTWKSDNDADMDKLAWSFATQMLIWETVIGERDENFNHVDTGSYGSVTEVLASDNPVYSKVMSYYESMVSSVKNHSRIPSFMAKSSSKAQTAELTWNGTAYVAVLTDTNNVLGNYNFSGSGLSFSTNDNKLTITASAAPSGEVTITATKKDSTRCGVIVWSDGTTGPADGLQDLATYTAEVNDPISAFLNVSVSAGSLKIVKTSEDGVVAGM